MAKPGVWRALLRHWESSKRCPLAQWDVRLSGSSKPSDVPEVVQPEGNLGDQHPRLESLPLLIRSAAVKN